MIKILIMMMIIMAARVLLWRIMQTIPRKMQMTISRIMKTAKRRMMDKKMIKTAMRARKMVTLKSKATIQIKIMNLSSPQTMTISSKTIIKIMINKISSQTIKRTMSQMINNQIMIKKRKTNLKTKVVSLMTQIRIMVLDPIVDLLATPIQEVLLPR